ncbi:MAG: AEC family transporter [Eggerthellaceae bacterium]|nr:AEC family transporter [Eggerthellaceae bacterium]
MVVLQQMVIFFILMGVGFAARKTGILAADFLPKLSALIANVAGPCLIMSGAIDAGERLTIGQAGFAFAVFIALTAAMVVIGRALPVLLRYPTAQRPAMNFAFWMTNIGYLGMPFAVSVYGSSAQIYVVLYLIVNNLLLYTYGIWLMQTNDRATAGTSTQSNLRGLLNPGVAAVAITVVLYFGGIELPYVIGAPIKMLGSTTAPLAMMLVGAQLMEQNLGQMLRDVRLAAFTLLKMLALPIVLLLAVRPFVADPNLFAACLAIVAMPSGVLVSAFSLLYDPKNAPVATRTVAFTTFVAVVTVPLVALAVGL